VNVKKMGTVVLALLVGSSAWAAAPKSSPELLAKGKTSYTRNCQACHGEAGDGNGPTGQFLNPKPRDFRTGPFKKGNKPEEIFNTISTGLPGSAMVPFTSLPEEERWALTYYVLSFQPQGKGAKKDAPPAKGNAKGKK
jgi:mono/diheme cytochrome c family protein